MDTQQKTLSTKKSFPWIYPFLFLAVAIVGLIYVKWNPYYFKALSAAATHSIGASILTGKSAAAPVPSWQAALSYTIDYFTAVWKAVILGLLLGSLVQVLIPAAWIKSVLGSRNFSSTALAGAASLPGMMCTCCAAPVAVGLRARSASVGAALAFFLGNPVLNPATIIFMGFVLSWKFAMFRLIAGLIMVLGIATAANKMAIVHDVPASLLPDTDNGNGEGHLFKRWLYALYQLIIDTIPAYLIVVFVLGAVRAWLFPAIGPEWGDSLMVLIGFAITGALFVVPTAAEIPIVQTLLTFGLGIGPAMALLMTLPAVSLPSLLIVKRAFPARILTFVLAAVIVVGIVSGVIATYIF
jgi:uncharacterized membrane protein YraQ (UPF0718 family)